MNLRKKCENRQIFRLQFAPKPRKLARKISRLATKPCKLENRISGLRRSPANWKTEFPACDGALQIGKPNFRLATEPCKLENRISGLQRSPANAPNDGEIFF